MKRAVLILALFLFLPSVLAVNINMKDNFQPGETLLATIEGNFLSPLTPDSIFFISDRESIPLFFDIASINNKYYLYATLPIKQANYTFLVKNAHYYENSHETTIDIEKNFSVSGNTTDFSVSPGFIVTKNNFTLTIESENSALDITASVLNQSRVEHIPLGQTKKLDFTVNADNFTQASVSLSALATKYEIPIFIIGSSNASTNGTNATNTSETGEFSFTQSGLNFSVNNNKASTFQVYLKNEGNNTINNIAIRVSTNLDEITDISPSNLNLSSEESREIDITINTNDEGTFSGRIFAETENLTTYSDIAITSLSENTSIPIVPNQKETCNTYGGIPCSSSQQCQGTVRDSLDGACCLGTCQAKKSYTAAIIGVILILAVIAGLFFLYKRQKAHKSLDSKQIITKKAEDFEKRMGVESRGSLSKS